MQKDASGFDDMTNIPKKERTVLSQNFYVSNLETEKFLKAKILTTKLKNIYLSFLMVNLLNLF